MSQKSECREKPGEANLSFWKASFPHPGTDERSLLGRAGTSAAGEAALPVSWAGSKGCAGVLGLARVPLQQLPFLAWLCVGGGTLALLLAEEGIFQPLHS